MTTTEFLTQDELASRWDVETRTLYNWRKEGKGPPFLKLGKKIRYRLSDVLEYEEKIIKNKNEK